MAAVPDAGPGRPWSGAGRPSAHRGRAGAAGRGRAGRRGVPVHEPGHVAPAHPHRSSRRGGPAGRAGRRAGHRRARQPLVVSRSSSPSSCSTCRASPSSTTPTAARAAEAVADLLWFPTGGGKTEAYLGLTAYTLALRRLQGTVAGRSGEDGVAVLMRYTLRLLTLQQFQRATALICACEVDPPRGRAEATPLGQDAVPHRPVGRPADHAEHDRPGGRGDQAGARRQVQGRRRRAARPHQLTNCPWCGSEDRPRQATSRSRRYSEGPVPHAHLLRRRARPVPVQPPGRRRGEGLPVLVVDEEIYRRLPSLLIATVDKFAQMPWKGEVADALRAGRRLLRPPRVPVARDRGRRQPPQDKDELPAGQDHGPPAAAAARPDHPGRAAPDQRAARDAGRAVRDGRRPALLVGGRTARRSGPR